MISKSPSTTRIYSDSLRILVYKSCRSKIQRADYSHEYERTRNYIAWVRLKMIYPLISESSTIRTAQLAQGQWHIECSYESGPLERVVWLYKTARGKSYLPNLVFSLSSAHEFTLLRQPAKTRARFSIRCQCRFLGICLAWAACRDQVNVFPCCQYHV